MGGPYRLDVDLTAPAPYRDGFPQELFSELRQRSAVVRFGGPGRIMMGKLGGVRLQLVEMQTNPEPKIRPNHCGLFMCSVAVRELDTMRARLKAADIPITRQVDVSRTRMLVVTEPRWTMSPRLSCAVELASRTGVCRTGAAFVSSNFEVGGHNLRSH